MPIPIRVAEKNKSISLLIGDRKFEVFQGDVLQLKADALVCPVGRDLDLSSGIAEVIVKAAGQKVKEDRPEFPEPLGKVVVMPGGNLNVKYIFLTVVLGENDPQKLKRSIRQAIDRTIRYAEFLRLRSLAFPVLGCPRTNPPYTMVAREMLEDVTKYFRRRNTRLKTIFLSAYNNNAFEAFKEEARSFDSC